MSPTQWFFLLIYLSIAGTAFICGYIIGHRNGYRKGWSDGFLSNLFSPKNREGRVPPYNPNP